MLCYNLLIAEDEPKLRSIIRDYFQNKGFKVTEVSNGMSALEAAKDRDFDIILLDVMMPRLDGFSVCRAIRKEQDVPIMFLTAKIEEEDQLAGYQAQADDYVTKPFSLPVLHAKVQALLQRRNGNLPAEAEPNLSQSDCPEGFRTGKYPPAAKEFASGSRDPGGRQAAG